MISSREREPIMPTLRLCLAFLADEVDFSLARSACDAFLSFFPCNREDEFVYLRGEFAVLAFEAFVE
jgi:hypothetical protein